MEQEKQSKKESFDVLIVEDDPAMGYLIEKALEEEYISSRILENGIETIAFLKNISQQNQKLPLLLLDNQLSDLTGKSVMEKLLTEEINPPFIFMTGNGSERLAVEMMKLGAKDYLVKEAEFLSQIGPVTRRVLKVLEMEKKLRDVESALWENEERFRAMIEHSSDLIVILDARGDFNYVAPSVKNILGYSTADFYQKSWKEAVFKEDWKKARSCFFDVLRSGKKMIFKLEMKMQHKNGILLDFEVVFNNLLDFDSVGGIIVNCRDISERKEAEKRLLEYQESLEQRVEERTRELQAALQKEKELGELKSRFVSMASHEFRTPLTVILSASDVLKRYGPKLTEQEKGDRIEKIQTQVLHMTRMLDDILLIGKAQLGKFDFSPAPTDILSLVQESVEDCRAFSGRLHQIVFKVTGKPRLYYCDRKLFLNLVTNLIGNAVKYSAAGTRVDITLDFQDLKVLLSVQDQGIGIPLEDEKKLFEPFHRGSNTTGFSGNGLGLTIVKQAADLHRAKISVQSEKEKGSVFTVAFPYRLEIEPPCGNRS